MKRSKGFTLIELLVVIAIIALLVSILLPSLHRARELAKRTMCMTGLSGIGKAILMYSAENNDAFPSISNAQTPATAGEPGVAATDDIDALDGDTSGTDQECNILDNLCLLVEGGTIGWGSFICPSTGKEPGKREPSEKYGFNIGGGTDDNITYAMHKGYGNSNAATFSSISTSAPILMDNAGKDTDNGKLVAAGNHGTDLVNALAMGGSVSKIQPDGDGYIIFAGDNPYTAGTTDDDLEPGEVYAPGAEPQSVRDIVMYEE